MMRREEMKCKTKKICNIIIIRKRDRVVVELEEEAKAEMMMISTLHP